MLADATDEQMALALVRLIGANVTVFVLSKGVVSQLFAFPRACDAPYAFYMLTMQLGRLSDGNSHMFNAFLDEVCKSSINCSSFASPMMAAPGLCELHNLDATC
jgi:hypothetical protein